MVAKTENVREVKPHIRQATSIVLDARVRTPQDAAEQRKADAAFRRLVDVHVAAMVMAHREHQAKRSMHGLMDGVLKRFRNRERDREQIRKMDRMRQADAHSHHPTDREWRYRLTATDERAAALAELGIDVTDPSVYAWWYALDDLARMAIYREGVDAQLDEMEQRKKGEQKARRDALKSAK